MSTLVDTAGVDRRDRAEHWHDAHERLFFPVGVEFADDDATHGSIEGHSLGQLGVYRVRSDASVVWRRPKGIAQDDPEQFLLGTAIAGRCRVEQGGRVSPFAPGEMSSWQSSDPFSVIHHEPFELLLLTMPTALLGARRDLIARRTAMRISADSGLGLVAASLFRQVAELPEPGRLAPVGEDITDSVIALTRALHRLDYDDRSPGAQLSSGVLREQIKGYVLSHLGDLSLRPESIARAHYISTRYLHKLFAAEDVTVSEWIRGRRLEACARDLRDPLLASLPIAEVARRWGILDAGHFSRLFRQAYGSTPSEYRAAARQ